jgi:hypothetical protein
VIIFFALRIARHFVETNIDTEQDCLRIAVIFYYGKYHSKCTLDRYFPLLEIETLPEELATALLIQRVKEIIYRFDKFIAAANLIDSVESKSRS